MAQSGFKPMASNEAPEPLARPMLRFKVGDRVDARQEDGRLEGGYEPGVVTRLWDKNGKYPYRIALDNGSQVWGPEDIDTYVKRGGSLPPESTIKIKEKTAPRTDNMTFAEWKTSTGSPAEGNEPQITPSSSIWGCDNQNLEALKDRDILCL